MELIIKALMQKYEAEKSAAIAELSVILLKPTSIPNHAGIVEECDKQIQLITDAEGKISILNNIISGIQNGNNKPPEEH